jgi:hypothetical protein
MDAPAVIPSFTLAKAVTVPTTSEAQQRQAQRQLAQQIEDADPTTYLTHFSRSSKMAADSSQQVELLASADSTNGICLFSRQTLDFGGRITGHEDTVTRIAFAKHNPSVLWSSSHDGSIRCWDLRTQGLAHMFYGTLSLSSPPSSSACKECEECHPSVSADHPQPDRVGGLSSSQRACGELRHWRDRQHGAGGWRQGEHSLLGPQEDRAGQAAAGRCHLL